MKKTSILALTLALLLTGCGDDTNVKAEAAAAAPGASTTSGNSANADWPNFGGDGREQHYSALDQVNLGNVQDLSLAWYYDLEPGFSVSAPVKGGDKLFTTTGHSHIRAFDAATGKLLWEYDAGVRKLAKSSLQMTWGNKGIAWWNGRVFLATTDGRVIALDDKTGKPLWEKRQFQTSDLLYTNGAPRVFDGKVIIGQGGADISPIRGFVTAYDAMTGKQLWRFYAVPGDPSKPATTKAEKVMRPTWKGDWYGKGGGGTAWNAFSYDPDLNLIYLGLGNGFPYNQDMRSPGGGDNLFLASIVAVNADTGEYVWHYQVCPAEQWDCTAVQDMTLATIDIDGKPRKVLMQAPKNGFFYVLDAATGKFISAKKFAKVTWAKKIDQTTGRPVENPGIRYQHHKGLFELWPGPQGAHSWLPQAFSPRTGLVYIPVMELGALVGPPAPNAPPMVAGMGVTMIPDANLPGSRRSYLEAWDPIAQKARWKIDLPGDWPGGVLATAGDLVFQGRIDGYLIAYNAKTGDQVWSFKTISPIVAPPISYSVNGTQYVTVLTGSGSQGGGLLATGNEAYRTDYALPRRVLTFAIGGAAKRPAYTIPARQPLSDPGFKPQKERVMAGAMAFAGNACIVCHGMNAIGGGAAPDLRYSPMILSEEAFKSVVKNGVLKPRGMPPFPQISDQDLENIRHYLRLRAMQAPAEAAALKAGKKAPAGGSDKPQMPTGT